jgi:hypothetical protein
MCIDSANQVIPENDWRLVSDHLSAWAEYCVSPLTVIELLNSLAKSDAQDFQKRRERLRRVYEPGQKAHFFDYFRFFVAEVVFGIALPRPANLENDFGEVIKIVLAATSAEELCRGVRHLQREPRINLDRFVQQFNHIQQEYIVYLNNHFKGGTGMAPIPDETEWARGALTFLTGGGCFLNSTK